MASPNWIGGAPAIAQVNTITIASVASTNTFSITIGNATLTVTAGGGDTVTTIAVALIALASAATAPPQFQEATWTSNAGVITMTQLAAFAGQPITQTSAATGGTASATTATTTASSGPNWWSVAANWSTGAVPVTGDTVNVTGAAANISYGLDQHSVTLAALYVHSKTIQIGLPAINANNSNGYPEYRPAYLQIGATVCAVFQASGRVKLDFYSIQTSCTVEASQTSADNAAGIPAVLLKGTHASNVLYQLGGVTGVAFYGGEIATFATIGSDGGTLTIGAGVTLTTLTGSGGGITCYCSATTVNLNPGSATVTLFGGALAYTTINVWDGTLSYEAGGTIGQLNVGLTGTADFTNDIQARTVTNATFTSGATVLDSSHTVTFSNAFVLKGCRWGKDVTLDFGVGRSYTIAA